jgi:2-oxo-4-hydroxy-4-carboxy-5-ureidoimidazoline decarboxylase
MEPWQTLNKLPEGEARTALLTCCGSKRWVERMLVRRPFADHTAMVDTAREEWFALSTDDWYEAFGHHPRIGDRESLAARFGGAGQFAENEQAGVAGATQAVLDELAQANQAYETKFGFTFIVCATGKSATEMLGLLRARIINDPATEIQVAADEHAKITEIRLNQIRVLL